MRVSAVCSLLPVHTGEVLLWIIEMEFKCLCRDLKDDEHIKESHRQSQEIIPIVQVYLDMYSIGYFLLLSASRCCFYLWKYFVPNNQKSSCWAIQELMQITRNCQFRGCEIPLAQKLLFPIYDTKPLNITVRNEISLTAFTEARQW